MADVTLARALCILVPAVVGVLLFFRHGRDRKLAAAALLATNWNMTALVVLHLLASHYGWWRFTAQGGMFLAMPIDLYLGWALLWGAIPVLAAMRVPLVWVALVLFLIDLLVLPRFAPTIILGDGWPVGEAVALLLCLIPAQLLARWMYDDRRLAARALLVMIAFNGLMLGVIPALIIERTGGGWQQMLERPLWLNLLLLLLLVVLSVLNLSAIQEFVQRGRGTPSPLDPPKRLVMSGVYAYVANPLEVSGCLLMVGLGVLFASKWTVAAGLVAMVHCSGLRAWHEEGLLAGRYGEAWRAYRRAVGRWLPSWRPWHDPDAPRARLYLPAGSALGAWLERHQPRGLTLITANASPQGFIYEAVEGRFRAEGLGALGRALDHVNLGWAFVGWSLRLLVPGTGNR